MTILPGPKKQLTRKAWRFATLAGAAVVGGLLWVLPAAGSASQSGTLPGGTSIAVSIDNPADGATFLVPPGGTASVTVSGTASVGTGVPIKDTTVVYVLDVSGSMTLDAGVDCTGDGINDTRLKCAQVAIAGANAAAADPFSAIKLTGLASFASSAAVQVVDLASGGTAVLVAPSYDGNGNSISDLVEVADSLTAPLGGQTNFAAGLQAGVNILQDPLNTSAHNILLFLSDADASSVFVGANVSTVTIPANTTIDTFGMGVGPSCTFNGGVGSLNAIAAMSTAGTGICQVVTDMSKLADFITQSIGSSLTSLQIAIDGGTPTTIPNSDISAPGLPQTGPASVTYSTVASDLSPGDHEICVTANGSDAGGSGSVSTCVTIHVVISVGIDIKPGSYPNSINTMSQGKIPVAILGSAAFAVNSIDTNSLTFGATGNEDSLAFCSGLEDVNSDGFADLVCHFTTQATGFAVGDTVGILKGTSTAGPFQATDSVRIVH